MEKVTLYIPCFNAASSIAECFEGLLRQSHPADEILLIDDGSEDETVRMARSYPVRVIKHGSRRGLAAARNTAFREARNEFVAALDADCVPTPDWLEILMKEFLDASVAGVGGRLIEKYDISAADRWRKAHMSQHWGGERLENPPFLSGNNGVFRKDAVFAAGLYDERYRTNYEDCDISSRLMRKGFHLVYTPAARVFHLRRDSVRTVFQTSWNWHFHAWPKPLSCADLLRKTGENCGLLGHWLRQDLRSGFYQLALLDAAALVYGFFLDLRFYLCHRGVRKKCL